MQTATLKRCEQSLLSAAGINNFATLTLDRVVVDSNVSDANSSQAAGGVLSFGGSKLLDLTNPAAVTWAKGVMGEAITQGSDGWMADFAEWQPTVCAQVAEVSVDRDGAVHVHRVVCAVDCGPAVNVGQIEAQIQGGIVYGLTAALYGEITIEKGRVKQGNFTDYPMMHIQEMPAVEVYVVPSTEKQGGIGEPSVGPIAPAVCNAIFAATGKRIRRLPIGRIVST